MAKKHSAAKKAAGGKTAKAVTPAQVHRRVSALLEGKALKGKIAEAFAAEEFAAAAAAPVAADVVVKPVSFTCSNIGCLVSITSGSIHFVFSGTGGAKFPVGVSRIFYGVQGPKNQAFSITVQGATLDFPIAEQLDGQGIGGGRRHITVAA
jgi:hypothetical protein